MSPTLSPAGNHSLVGSGPDANNLPYNGKPYTIPYRCLLPKDVQNLLLCGRCISGTHMAHASYRLMPICMAMGQAAGAAAALCTQNRWSPCALPVGQLQELLLQQGYPRPSHAV
ncbi:MAG: FAD-dependent oxidoreductase [Clostridia bacterium]